MFYMILVTLSESEEPARVLLVQILREYPQYDFILCFRDFAANNMVLNQAISQTDLEPSDEVSCSIFNVECSFSGVLLGTGSYP